MSPGMFVINKHFAVLSLPNLRSGVLFSWKAGKSADWGKGDKFFLSGSKSKREEGSPDRRLSPSRFCRPAGTNTRNRLARSCEISQRGGEWKRKRLEGKTKTTNQ